MLKSLIFIVTQVILVFVLAIAVNASTVPNFPSCSNPQGTLKVNYDNGTHYIVGGSGVSGSDAVYYTGEMTLIQCFCADSGSGIQTNWWKLNSLTQEEVDQLVKLGWYYIPNGADWGLDNAAYMAQNANYSCKPGDTPPGNPTTPAGPPVCTSTRPTAPQIVSVVRSGTKATVTWTKVDNATHYTLAYGTKLGDYPYGVPNTGNVTSFEVGALNPNQTYYFRVYAVNNCMPSDPSGQLPQGGSVLGLSTTGDIKLLYTVFASSALLLAAGVTLRKKSGNI